MADRNSNRYDTPVDWPVNLIAKRIQEAVCQQITDQWRDSRPEQEVLRQFGEAVRCKYPLSVLKRWLDFRKDVLPKDHEGLLQAEKLLGQIEEVSAAALPVESDLKLLRQLLGVTIFRPVVYSDRPAATDKPWGLDSSLYYASVYHPLSDEQTQLRVMETVIVPPGRGSAGAAARADMERGCSPNSFGERVGTVEWQDLVLGQFSFLARRLDSEVSDSFRPLGSSWFVATAFLPVPCVFHVTASPGRDDLKSENYLGILAKSIDRVGGASIVCAQCDAQDDFRARRHQLRNDESDQPEDREYDVLAHQMVDQLAPASFIQRPVPLRAAAAIVGNAGEASCRLAAMSVSLEALRMAVAQGLSERNWLQSSGSSASAELHDGQTQVQPGVPGSLFDLLGGPKALQPAYVAPLPNAERVREAVHPSDVGAHFPYKVFVIPEDRELPKRLAAIWVLHATSDISWPARLDLSPVRVGLDALVNRLRQLSSTTSPICGPGSENCCSQRDLNATIQFGTYKTTLNLLELYFRIISWPFLFPTPAGSVPGDVAEKSDRAEALARAKRRLKWNVAVLRYVLTVALSPTSPPTVQTTAVVRALVGTLVKARRSLSKRGGVWGTSAGVMIPAQPVLTNVVLPGMPAGDNASAGKKEAQNRILVRMTAFASAPRQTLTDCLLNAEECIVLGQPPGTTYDVMWSEETAGSLFLRQARSPITTKCCDFRLEPRPYFTASLKPDTPQKCREMLRRQFPNACGEQEVRDGLLRLTGLSFRSLATAQPSSSDALTHIVREPGVLLGSFRDPAPTSGANAWPTEHRAMNEFFLRSLRERRVRDEHARLIGQEEDRRFFAHEALGSLQSIWDDPARSRMTHLAQFLLWEHRDLLQYTFSRRELDQFERLTGSGRAWDNLTREGFVNLAIDAALVHAVKRTSYPPSREVAKRDSLHLGIQERYARLGAEACANRVKLDLEMKMNDVLVCAWANERGFLHFFFNALWQAAYHALLAFRDNVLTRPLLRVSFGDREVSVANWCESSGRKVDESSHDVVFMTHLEQRLRERYTIRIQVVDDYYTMKMTKLRRTEELQWKNAI